MSDYHDDLQNQLQSWRAEIEHMQAAYLKKQRTKFSYVFGLAVAVGVWFRTDSLDLAVASGVAFAALATLAVGLDRIEAKVELEAERTRLLAWKLRHNLR